MTLRILVLALSLLASLRCGNRGQQTHEILIGGYGSLTGTTASFGQSTMKGIQLAVAQANQSGGVIGKQIRLIMEDDQGKPEEAQTVVTKLVTKDRVVAVIGENSSSRSLAGAPVCQQNRIPMISPSSTNPKVTQVGDYIFRVCFIDPFQGLVMARFATNTLRVRAVAILRDVKNDYSIGLAEVFRENFEKLGGKIVGDQSYGEGDTDFSAQLTALRAVQPEAIFIPGYYTEAGLIARQARKLGITAPLLGGDGWESSKLWEIGGMAMNDCYYSNHYSINDPDPTIQEFIREFKQRFGEVPDATAALAYDTAQLLFDAIRRTGTTDPLKVRDALATARNFPGVTGAITMDQNRNPIKPAVILRLKDGKIEYVETIQP